MCERDIQLLRPHLWEERESIKIQTDANKGEGGLQSMRTFAYNFLIEDLVHKLLSITTRFFVSFLKIPVLVKISVLKNHVLPLTLKR